MKKHALLPKVWWGITPSETKQIGIIVAKYKDNSFGLECLDELHESMSMLYSDMDDLRVCTSMSNEYIKPLDYKVGIFEDIN